MVHMGGMNMHLISETRLFTIVITDARNHLNLVLEGHAYGFYFLL